MSASVVIPKSEEGSGVMEIEELQRQLTETQAALGSSEQLKNLFMKKVKDCKHEKINAEKELMSKMLILNDQKKEVLSLLEKQKAIIDELMLKESHKIKRIRKQKCELIGSYNEAEEKVNNVKRHNEVLQKRLSEEEQKSFEFAAEIERLNKALVEEENYSKKLEEEKTTLRDQNQLLAATLIKCEGCIAMKERKLIEVKDYLQQEQEKLKKVAVEFLEEREKLEADLVSATNKSHSFEIRLLQISKENTSLLMKVAVLSSDITDYQRVADEENSRLVKLEIENDSLKHNLDATATANKELDHLNVRMENQLAIQGDQNLMMLRKLVDYSAMFQKVAEKNEKIVANIQGLEHKAEFLMKDVADLQLKKQKKCRNIFRRILQWWM